MTLAPFVHALGRGPGRSRALEQKEAREAMALILSGQAAPEAVGAMLMLMRYRGETAEEIAGFVEAMRDRVSPWANLPVTLDWPSYASGRSRGLPLFLLAAKLAAEAGHKVLLHGWNSTQNPLADIRSQIGSVGISSVETPEAAKAALARDGIVYVPLEALDPDQMRVLQLRDVLGLRSPINTALRALNPARAKLAVQGVFHPPYRALQQDAAALLGDSTLLVLKGGGGEFERHPSKDTLLYGLDRGDAFERTASAMSDETRRLADQTAKPEDLAALWSGSLEDPFAEATVTGTLALVLYAGSGFASLTKAQSEARALWLARRKSLAA